MRSYRRLCRYCEGAPIHVLKSPLPPRGKARKGYRPGTLVTEKPGTWVTHWTKMGANLSGGMCCPGKRRARKTNRYGSLNSVREGE